MKKISEQAVKMSSPATTPCVLDLARMIDHSLLYPQ
jgi:hypothetical protein